MSDTVGVNEFFTKIGSARQAKFLLSENPVIEMRMSGPTGEGGRAIRHIKITKVERDDDVFSTHAIHVALGGFRKLLPNLDSSFVCNHPQIKDKSFKFEWVK